MYVRRTLELAALPEESTRVDDAGFRLQQHRFVATTTGCVPPPITVKTIFFLKKTPQLQRTRFADGHAFQYAAPSDILLRRSSHPGSTAPEERFIK